MSETASPAVPGAGEMPAGRGVRLFVSSTFRDMQAEREELMRRVFPQLREACAARGLDWVEVDLRWGITEAQAQQGQVVPLCLREVAACFPHFLGVLGGCYGSISRGDAAEWAAEFPELGPWPGASVTELEIRYALALARRRGSGCCRFYFREDDAANPRTAAWVSTGEAAARLAALKDDIHRSGWPVRVYREPAELGALVLSDLRADLAAAPAAAGRDDDPLAVRSARQALQVGRLVRRYAGRGQDFDALEARLRRGSVWLAAERGSGRSAFLANWLRWRRGATEHLALADDTPWARGLRRARTVLSASPWREAQVVHLIVGLDAAPVDLGLVLRQLGAALPAGPAGPEADAVGVLEWRGLLAEVLAARRAPLLLVLDGLEALAEDWGARELDWLPDPLPETVRVVAAAAGPEWRERALARGWSEWTPSPPDPARIEAIAAALLAVHGKRLEPDALRRLAAAPVFGRPKALAWVIDDLRLLGSRAELAERLDEHSRLERPELFFTAALPRWERLYEAGRMDLVRDTLGLLLAAGDGLAEGELLALLAPEGRLAAAVWSPFLMVLKPHLAEDGCRLVVAERALAEAAATRYLAAPGALQAFHHRLAEFFAARPWSVRKALQLPAQRLAAEDWVGLRAVLLDAGFAREGDALGAGQRELWWRRLAAGTGRPLAGLVAEAWPEAPVRTRYLLLRLLIADGAVEPGRRLLVTGAAGADDDLELERLNLAAILAWRAGDEAGARTGWEALAATAAGRGDRRAGAAAWDGLAAAARLRHDAGEAADWSARAVAAWRELGDRRGLARSLAMQAEIAAEAGARVAALAGLAEAERMARAGGDGETLRRVAGIRARLLTRPEDAAEARRSYAQEQAWCRRLAEPGREAESLAAEAGLETALGDYDRADQLLAEAEALVAVDPAAWRSVRRQRAALFAGPLGDAETARRLLAEPPP